MGPKYVRFMFRKKQLERLEYKTGCSNSSSYKKRLRGDKVPHLFRYSCSKSIHFPKSSLSDVDNPNELLSPLSLEREEQGVMVMSHKRQKLNPGRSMIAISSEQTQIRDQANEEKSVELGQKGEVYAESLMEDGELSGERDDNGFTMDLSESVSDSAKDNVQSGERDDNGFTMDLSESVSDGAKDNVQSGERDDNGFTMDLSESVSDGAKDNVQSGERDVNVVSMELSESSVDGAKVDAQPHEASQQMEPRIIKSQLSSLHEQGHHIEEITHDESSTVSGLVTDYQNPDGSRPKDRGDLWHFRKNAQARSEDELSLSGKRFDRPTNSIHTNNILDTGLRAMLESFEWEGVAPTTSKRQTAVELEVIEIEKSGRNVLMEVLLPDKSKTKSDESKTESDESKTESTESVSDESKTESTVGQSVDLDISKPRDEPESPTIFPVQIEKSQLNKSGRKIHDEACKQFEALILESSPVSVCDLPESTLDKFLAHEEIFAPESTRSVLDLNMKSTWVAKSVDCKLVESKTIWLSESSDTITDSDAIVINVDSLVDSVKPNVSKLLKSILSECDSVRVVCAKRKRVSQKYSELNKYLWRNPLGRCIRFSQKLGRHIEYIITEESPESIDDLIQKVMRFFKHIVGENLPDGEEPAKFQRSTLWRSQVATFATWFKSYFVSKKLEKYLKPRSTAYCESSFHCILFKASKDTFFNKTMEGRVGSCFLEWNETHISNAFGLPDSVERKNEIDRRRPWRTNTFREMIDAGELYKPGTNRQNIESLNVDISADVSRQGADGISTDLFTDLSTELATELATDLSTGSQTDVSASSPTSVSTGGDTAGIHTGEVTEENSGSTKLPSSDSLKFTLGASTGISTNFTSQSVGISTSKSVSVSARRHASVSARNQTGPSVRTQPSISATGHVSVLPRIQARISVGRKASCSSSSGVSVSSRGQSSVSARSQADVSVRSQTSISGTGHGSASPRSQTNISVRCQVGVLSSRDGSVSARRCSANVSSSDSIGTQIPGDKESPIDFAEEKEFDKPSKSSSTRKRRPSKKRASSKCESATKKRPHYKKKKKTWSGKCKEGYKESPKINL
eukprot:933132_1